MGRSVRVTGALAGAAMLVVMLGSRSVPAAPTDVPPYQLSPVTPSQIVMTLLAEVGRGTVDGREFLTLRVTRPVGPSACRGAVLRVDSAELGSVARRQRIETAALSAMLDDQAVSVTVPLDAARCVDGKPTFTDVRPLRLWP